MMALRFEGNWGKNLKILRKISGIIGLLSVVLTLSVSCVEEKIEPAFPIEKIEDQINDFAPLSFSIPIDRIQVDDQFGQVDNISARPIGMVFRRLAEMLADVQIQRGEAGLVKLGPFKYTLNELDTVQFEFVKDIIIQRVQLRINPRLNGEKEDNGGADFTFIKGLEVFIRFEDEHVGNSGTSSNPNPRVGTNTVIVDREKQNDDNADNATDSYDDLSDSNTIPSGPSDELFKQAYLVLSYQKDVQAIGCNNKCLELMPHQINWIEKLKKNRTFSVLLKMQVLKAPKQEFSLAGRINVTIPLKLGL